MPPDLMLASTSAHRRTLLNRLGLPFSVESPGIDEAGVPGEPPSERARRLAEAKASAVSQRHPAAWVLGSDQVADCGGRLFGKPGNAEPCRLQLAACSGRAVVFHTAVALLRARPAAREEFLDRTVVHFRALSPREIDYYVEREQPLDCAGGFRCEGLGIALFDRIDTVDPTALIGLPLIAAAAALRRAGLNALAPVQD